MFARFIPSGLWPEMDHGYGIPNSVIDGIVKGC
ncbi:hypothetical protein JOF35_002333 [Streptomyces demainii]|uniref:Uncharacterized protein n=1 Tax=Streptomyces demainii TaxID=588122 RepID=A0ABT9KRK9_9ACTN|nr:hypothetical protein [Streptomyces demainii]